MKGFIKSIPWLALFLVVIAILAGNLAGGGLQTLFSKPVSLTSTWEWAKLIIYILILFFCLIWLYRIRGAFMSFRTLSSHPCEPHKYLIILLSTPNIPVSISNNAFPLTIKNKAGEEAILKGVSLEEDIESLNALKNPWWNWHQLLRGLTPHKKLQAVYLIGSKDTPKIPGSWHDLNNAENLIRKYFPAIEIEKLKQPVDFEDFDEIIKFVTEAISEIKKRGISEKDIIVDVTGGQKTTSIAGAVVTMNRKVTFQYVQTIPDYQVLAYDVFVLPGASFEG